MEHDGVIGEEEIEAAIQVLRSRKLWLYNGDRTTEFENAMASYVNAKHGVAVFNATCAMEIALEAAKIGPGDEVITTPFTFIATQTAILRQHAIPTFADIDPRTFNLSPEAIKTVVSKRSKAILPVSIFGHPLDMDPIIEIAEDHDLTVIEDAAQSLGAEYRGRKVGSLAHMTCLSFTSPKAITSAGEGGMIMTNDDELARMCGMIRAFGYDRKKAIASGRLLHEILGWNARMTEIQAAVGLEQLRKLEGFNQRRKMNAEYLSSRLGKLQGIVPPYVSKDVRHSFWQYTIRVKEKILGMSRDAFRKTLFAEGVESHVYYGEPNYKQPVIARLGGYDGFLLPAVEEACREVLSLPVHNLLTQAEIEAVANAVHKIASTGSTASK